MSDEAKTYALQGMTCTHCAHTIETAIKGVPGVSHARVNYIKRQADVQGEASDEAVAEAVRHAGYQATPKDGAARA